MNETFDGILTSFQIYFNSILGFLQGNWSKYNLINTCTAFTALMLMFGVAKLTSQALRIVFILLIIVLLANAGGVIHLF